ncbi:hypothetical protein PC119_g13332 [Phytophthora cactorum]|uniref:Alcohol dehydrogenase-like C-terminal domain-containing protein n=1 Tax=Phytophthora cactorum TaxID=29920 RepID=A0A8T0YYR7_9STRA|nr:hypothetical protein PC112_g12346 [Phytophthora cactorum]KAG2854913.1 hypothetical protein PC113_g12891 [Phytophthora cactorum]KAG3011069.1 hypothetical protein PC119_g13332 [Phytophthora cactorum]
MLRLVSRFNQPARRVARTISKSFVGVHNVQCRCGNCVQHFMGCTCPRCQSRSFSVKSQSKYTIPKTQTAVIFDKTNGPLTVRKDWPVTQQKDLKPGEVLYARAMGYRVIAIDTGADKRKLIESYGIKDFIDFKDGNVREKVLAATEGRGAHATVVVASNPEAYNDALSFLRPHGAVVMVGLPKDAKVTADVFGSVLNAHRIIGSYVGNRQDSIEALKVAAGGDVSTNYSIEKLDNLPSVFERMEAGNLAGRVVLDCA